MFNLDLISESTPDTACGSSPLDKSSAIDEVLAPFKLSPPSNSHEVIDRKPMAKTNIYNLFVIFIFLDF